jgi:hypothetical protein
MLSGHFRRPYPLLSRSVLHRKAKVLLAKGPPQCAFTHSISIVIAHSITTLAILIILRRDDLSECDGASSTSMQPMTSKRLGSQGTALRMSPCRAKARKHASTTSISPVICATYRKLGGRVIRSMPTIPFQLQMFFGGIYQIPRRRETSAKFLTRAQREMWTKKYL